MAQTDEQWTQFAWRRFCFDVPLSWEPGAFEGDDLAGYVRLEDYFDARLEMRWKRSYREANIDVAARRYLDGVRQTVKRKRIDFKTEPRPYGLISNWPSDLEVRLYRWSAEVDCVAAVIQCSACHRLTALQIFFPLGTLSPAIAKRILSSFSDHTEGGEDRWRLYLMDIRAPEEWRLTEHNFGPGYAEMKFAGPHRLLATFRRWGAAEIFLENTDLRTWFGGKWPKGIRPKEVLEAEVNGEAALVATREPRGSLDTLRRLIARKEASKKAMYWQGVAWHCQASNRLWEVDVFARTAAEAAEANWQVICHQL